jgi:hypothetical protein
MGFVPQQEPTGVRPECVEFTAKAIVARFEPAVSP